MDYPFLRIRVAQNRGKNEKSFQSLFRQDDLQIIKKM